MRGPELDQPVNTPRKALLERLHAIFGAATLYGRSTVAHALHDLALADARQGGDADLATWTALDDGDLREIAASLAGLLDGSRKDDLTLPAGSDAGGELIGSIGIGTEHLAVDVDRPGLHPARECARDIGGGNLDLLLGHIRRMTAGRPWAAIGLPTPVLIENHGFDHLLQWPPFKAAGGAVLQHGAQLVTLGAFRSRPPTAIHRLAADLATAMEILWEKRRAVGRRVSEARAAGTTIAAESGFPLAAVAIDPSAQAYDAEYEVVLQFDAWTSACRRGLVGSTVAADEKASHHIGPCFPVTDARVGWLRARGADGEIDGIARAIAEAAPEGASAVLARLAIYHHTRVTLPARSGLMHATLEWHRGRIRATLLDRGPLAIGHDTVTFWGAVLPATINSAAPGRRLDELAEVPFRCDATIREVIAEKIATTVVVDDPVWLVDCARGRTWRESEDLTQATAA